jgi:hypothetical protein
LDAGCESGFGLRYFRFRTLRDFEVFMAVSV